MATTRSLTCDSCGKKGARVKRVTRTCGQGSSEFLIENVPMVACPNCGEQYFTARTLQEIERIRRHWRQLTIKKKVSVARFGGAA